MTILYGKVIFFYLLSLINELCYFNAQKQFLKSVHDLFKHY